METYNDGVLQLYEDLESRTDFGAKKNEKKLVWICKLNFTEMSQRQKDLEFAQQQGFSLSLKVKTPFCRLVRRNKKYKAVICGGLYDVSYFDITKSNLFLYLEYIREANHDIVGRNPG